MVGNMGYSEALKVIIMVLRSWDMVFGDDFQGSGEVFRIKHGLKCFWVYYFPFFMQI